MIESTNSTDKGNESVNRIESWNDPRMLTDTLGADIVQFEVLSRPEMISHIRSKVAAFASYLPFTDDEIDEIRLAVGEAFANALIHGANPDWCFTGIEMERGCDFVKIVLIDRGCGFDPLNAGVAGFQDLATDGRGLMLMRKMMDEVTIYSSEAGTRVELIKKLSCSDA